MDNALVAVTDQDWFNHFRPTDRLTEVSLVNFWQPKTTRGFRALQPGQHFFFRLKHPRNAVAGWGIFDRQELIAAEQAWTRYGGANGFDDRFKFLARIGGYRASQGFDHPDIGSRTLSCLMLRDAHFLAQEDWMPWTRKMIGLPTS